LRSAASCRTGLIVDVAPVAEFRLFPIICGRPKRLVEVVGEELSSDLVNFSLPD
jgi:hypothetical protein